MSKPQTTSITELLDELSAYIVGREPELTLNDITAPVHGGTYDCVVVNAAGFDYDSVTLYVRLEIVQDPVDTLTESGASVSLTCVAESFPFPTQQWQILDMDSGLYDDILGQTGTALSLSPVQFEDYGRYRCVATNVMDGIESTVNSSSALLTGKLTILTYYSNYRRTGFNCVV